MNKLIQLFFVLSLGFATSAQANLVLSGPYLDNHNIGWDNTGIQITALDNVVLQSFDFANYGANDTIQLRSLNGDVLHAISFVGSGNEEISSIAANWSLVAGNTYNLISVDPNNSKWTYYTFPVANAHIQVNGGVGFGSNELEPYWFHFTNLATAPVPEPESYAMMVIGLGLLGMMVRRRRQNLQD